MALHYSFDQVNVLVNAAPLSGFASGDDVVSARRLNPSTTDDVTADGQMIISHSTDRRGEVMIRLTQTSPSNGYLSALVALQENNIPIPLIVNITDKAGNDLVSGTVGYIDKPADISRGVNQGMQEWRMVFERLVFAHRGLNPFSGPQDIQSLPTNLQA